MKVVYFSDDGIQFEDEDECLEYENKIRFSKHNATIKGLDSDNEPIEYLDPDFMQNAFTIVCFTKDDLEELNKRAIDDAINIDGIEDCGIVYTWMESDGKWESVSNLIKEHKNEILKWKNLIKKVVGT